MNSFESTVARYGYQFSQRVLSISFFQPLQNKTAANFGSAGWSSARDPLQKFVSALERTNPNRWEDLDLAVGSWIFHFGVWIWDLRSMVFPWQHQTELWTYVVYIHSLDFAEYVQSTSKKTNCKPCRLGAKFWAQRRGWIQSLERFTYLEPAVSVVLGFIGVKIAWDLSWKPRLLVGLRCWKDVRIAWETRLLGF